LFFLDIVEKSDQEKSAIMARDAEVLRQFLARVLNEVPLGVRRRASYYLDNVKRSLRISGSFGDLKEGGI
jgi:hypothetical protein